MTLSICPRCGQQATMIVVHGHYQCPLCRSVVDDCCSGLTCQKPSFEDLNEEGCELSDEEQMVKTDYRTLPPIDRYKLKKPVKGERLSKKERLVLKTLERKHRLQEKIKRRLEIWKKVYGNE